MHELGVFLGIYYTASSCDGRKKGLFGCSRILYLWTLCNFSFHFFCSQTAMLALFFCIFVDIWLLSNLCFFLRLLIILHVHAFVLPVWHEFYKYLIMYELSQCLNTNSSYRIRINLTQSLSMEADKLHVLWIRYFKHGITECANDCSGVILFKSLNPIMSLSTYFW